MAIANPNPNGVYSFADVQVTIIYAGNSTTIGAAFSNVADIGTAGFSDEGIRIERDEKNVMTKGADGSVMHSLVAAKTGRITMSFLKTSPAHAILSQIYNSSSVSSALWGRLGFLITQTSTGDTVTMASAAFKRDASNNYRTEGGVMDWEFDVGFVDQVLGNGQNATGVVNPI